MRNIFTRKTDEDTLKGHSSAQADDSMDELRKLLVGPLQSQFDEIQELMKDQGLHPEEVSKILPEAILIRSSRDDQMLRAMEPITEEAIKSSIRRNPRILVDVFVPVMLPAIKKAIATLIKEMIQTFSATLEHGLSMRGLKWRFEAFRSKRPFGEVALLHSLIYQVEQVFLIHRDTGLVLQHLVTDEAVAQDPDMVSAMLTAIQDFVRDSFGGTQDDSLENLQFGDRSVWMKQTSQLVLAAVVWGNAPVDLESVLHDTLNAIHFEHIDDLRNFDGDTAPFERSKSRLADCFRSQFKSKKNNPVLLWSLVALLVFGMGYGSFFLIREHIRWKDYLERLHKEPGIVITETDRKSGKYYVFGLRDPLSADPENMLKKTKLGPDKVRFDWELYHSSHPDFMIRRINVILRPPETITFELKNNILHARGAASRQWVADAEKLTETIPGILGFRRDDVILIDIKDMETKMGRIEKTLFLFDSVSIKIRSDQEAGVREAIDDIKELDRVTRALGKTLHIEIVGHTDSRGSDKRNMEISQKRAEELFSILTSGGVRPGIFTMKGVGAEEPMREELSEADREFNRSVSFNITIQDKEDMREAGTESSSEQDKGDEIGSGPTFEQSDVGSVVSDPVSGQGAGGEESGPEPKPEPIRTHGAEFGPL